MSKADNKAFKWILLLSILVFLVVLTLYLIPKSDSLPGYAKYLPLINACLNGTCFILLILSLWFIKKKQVEIHKKLNITTFILSSLFLITYIWFHSFGVETKYPESAPFRSLYLVVLLTHILLATIVLPLVLWSFYQGLKGNVNKHRKIVRWSYPIWLYVTLSGVIVYLMISPHYPF